MMLSQFCRRRKKKSEEVSEGTEIEKKRSTKSKKHKQKQTDDKDEPDSVQKPQGLDEILEWLYLGNAYQAADQELLQGLGITCILNLVGGRFPEEYDPDQFLMYPLSDYGADNLERRLKPCFKFLSNVKKRGEKVLVHCAMGVNRSPTVVIAYLMEREKWTLKDAIHHVLLRRPQTRPHDKYLQQLQVLEVKWSGVSTFSEEEQDALFPPYHILYHRASIPATKEEEEDSD